MANRVDTSAAGELGRYQCSHCTRRYKRSDHLARHARSHTQFKPYKCHICSKMFMRVDILNRHIIGHQGQKVGRDNSNSLQGNDEGAHTRQKDYPDRPAVTVQTPVSGAGTSTEHLEWGQPFRDGLSKLPVTVDEANSNLDGPIVMFHDLEMEPWSLLETPSAGELPAGFNFNELDLRLLDSYNVNVPFQLTTFPNCQPTAESTPKSTSSLTSTSTQLTNTISSPRSYWNFCHNTNLAPIESGSEPQGLVNDAVPWKKLLPASRDKILTIILGNSRLTSLFKTLSLFPSVELLDGLLRHYLTSPVSHAYTFLHLATFDPNAKSPELLASMISSASLLTPDPTLQKLGFTIQECVLGTLPRHFQAGNSAIRDLELAQAFLITVEVGLWSGQIKQTEAAESFLQPLLTMIRRTGKFNHSSYPKVRIDNVEDGRLESFWQEWVELESFKRLVFRVLKHDTNTSTALQTNPLISYAEVSLPLPQPTSLWCAPTAEQWKATFLNQGIDIDRTLTLHDYFNDPQQLYTLEKALDIDIARDAFLSCCWRLSWEYIQLRSFQAYHPQQWSSTVMSLRYEELIQLMRHFHSGVSLVVNPLLDAEMKMHYIQLHLHLPCHDIQLFSTSKKSDQLEAAFLRLGRWSREAPARKSILHAGQIIRIAASSLHATIRGPAAFMLYHAGLALLIYGRFSASKNRMSIREDGSPINGFEQRQVVRVDGVDSAITQQFVEFGLGTPTIQDFSDLGHTWGEVPVSNYQDISSAIIRVFRGNYKDSFRPPIVNQMIQLIVELQELLKAYSE
ncbi:uncharacterized protein NECHADRAFT_89456 [Fusarium vanettenii 77-13-4]|uniref:C2H2-type domain-containing protein n=1 Tax=Fusarium vanettenii (strain ATCC MYA-4622 / CBS 123669 / FGSC 9596 / NRRL 45880 / 77-13-4) TaxID=660122 RepID=C7ZR89_FUSV7|nr:uncharacterized protein NECHADRAFT_89456 [Fusarium vanettenii 77-13-4]EEU33469.1 hypothetical protein NECHADRAFT_89456 [Fusarium vanettenii 77-13-4]